MITGLVTAASGFLRNRSDATVGEDGVRNPVNYATAFIDLDFVYGRSADEAEALRTMENGLMNVSESGVPFQNADGSWLVRGNTEKET